MKTATTILTALLIPFFWGMLATHMAAQEKKYIMLSVLDSLDANDSLYRINHYTLRTKELYGVDETIEMYNVHHMGLVLFSVLPDFTSDENWSEVDLVDIQDQVFDEKTFRRRVEDHVLSQNGTSKKTLRYTLVKSENGKYFASNHCLTEFFYVVSHSSTFNTPYGVLNTGQQPITIKGMKRIFDQGEEFHAPKTLPFPLDVRGPSPSSVNPSTYLHHWWLVQREYLSRKLEIHGEVAYQFWTFTDWRGQDNLRLHRGVDRFIYIPGKGIVGGSYDFWFLYFDTWNNPPIERKRNNKTKEELWRNVLEEKVMLAEELK